MPAVRALNVSAALCILTTALMACEDKHTSTTCADEESLRVCVGDACDVIACRGDELCREDACRPWDSVALSADFEVEVSPADPHRITCRVLPGGFPRRQTELIRFSFGDDRAGFGEEISHRYERPGVYPVDPEVQLEGYRVLRASRLVTIDPVPESHEPLSLTINRFPAYLNGSRPFRSDNFTPKDPADDYDEPFTLLLPSHGFTVDVTLLGTDDDPILAESLVLVTDVDLGAASVEAGTNLADRLVFEEGLLRVPRASWTISPEEAFPDGLASLTLRGDTASGARLETSLRFQIRTLTPQSDPFDEPFAWLLRFDMDHYTVEGGTNASGGVDFRVRPGADGKPDFEQELRLIGGQGDESAPGAASLARKGHVGVNAIFLSRVKRRVVEAVYRVFLMGPDGTPRDGIAFAIHADGEPGAPDPLLFDRDGAFSMMRIGGVLEDALGRSWMTRHNGWRIDDTDPDLGVASASLLALAAGSSLLGDGLQALRPEVGTPVGDHPLDPVVLAPEFDRFDPLNPPEENERWDALEHFARVVALTLAPVTAHEMGHAMGLVPYGAPPMGFFAGRPDVDFIRAVGTDDAHVNMPGLNVMQAGGNVLGLIGDFASSVDLPDGLDVMGLYAIVSYELRLSPYERAYLQRRLTHW